MNSLYFHETANTSNLPWALWLLLPVMFVSLFFLLRVISEDIYLFYIASEYGPCEILTAVFLVIIGVASLKLYRKTSAPSKSYPSIRPFFLLLAIGSFVVAGEEISWGQHFFGWETPEFIAAHNDQQETNFHNVPYWDEFVDQKPRAIVSIIILLGGLVPILHALGMLRFIEKYPLFYWLMPTSTLIPAAFIVVFPRILDRIQVWFDVTLPFPFDIPTRHFQEFQELSIVLFAMLYVLNLLWRNNAGASITSQKLDIAEQESIGLAVSPNLNHKTTKMLTSGGRKS